MQLSVKTINKYKEKSVSQLIGIAEKHFNHFIRLRDSNPIGDGKRWGVCISSGKRLTVPSANAHAGHYFSAGHYPSLRFNEDNVHLQGKSDNFFKSGNESMYRINLVNKIGEERVKKLETLAQMSKRIPFKWDRFYLIEIIETYKEKVKKLKDA